MLEELYSAELFLPFPPLNIKGYVLTKGYFFAMNSTIIYSLSFLRSSSISEMYASLFYICCMCSSRYNLNLIHFIYFFTSCLFMCVCVCVRAVMKLMNILTYAAMMILPDGNDEIHEIFFVVFLFSYKCVVSTYNINMVLQNLTFLQYIINISNILLTYRYFLNASVFFNESGKQTDILINIQKLYGTQITIDCEKLECDKYGTFQVSEGLSIIHFDCNSTVSYTTVTENKTVHIFFSNIFTFTVKCHFIPHLVTTENCTCGIVDKKYIEVHGNWPFIAIIERNGSYFLGFLISNKTVLTDANIPTNETNVTVVLGGATYAKSGKFNGAKVYSIKEISDWNNSMHKISGNKMKLLHLDNSIRCSKAIIPICLQLSMNNRENETQTHYVAGFIKNSTKFGSTYFYPNIREVDKKTNVTNYGKRNFKGATLFFTCNANKCFAKGFSREN